MNKNTVRLHRVFAAPPERVYRAFLDPAAIVKWFPPHGFTATVHELHAKVGGTFKMSFMNFSSKKNQSFGGEFTELIENELIKYNDRFDDPNLKGEMQVSISFRKVICGTEIQIVQAGIPPAIPVEMCYLGWQQCLNLLQLLVEPQIPD